MLKAHVIVQDRNSLLVGLDAQEREQLRSNPEPTLMFARSSEVGLSGMLVGIFAAPTKAAMLDIFAPNITGNTTMHGSAEEPSQPGPVQINAMLGPEREQGLVLGCTHEHLAQLGDGAVFVIDGDEMGMPGYHVTLCGYDPGELAVDVLRRCNALMPKTGFDWRPHEHQPEQLLEGRVLAELYHDGQLGSFGELNDRGVPIKAWAASAGPGYACCTKGMR